MSANTEILERESKIYDDEGRTLIPSKVRDKVGLKKGDTLRFVVIEGDIKIIKCNDDSE